MDKSNVEAIFEKLDGKLKKTALSSYDKIPYSTENGVYDDNGRKDICGWTNGFWSALMFLMYSATKDEQYLKTGRHGMDMMDKALMCFDGLHHDVGFMWNISSGTDYRLTGDKTERNRFLIAANHLMGRYNAAGGFIRAWNDWDENSMNKGWTIIDCMMNIPLLFRAAEEIGDDRFAMVAINHADKTAKYHVRSDGSVNHIVEYDPTDGTFVKTWGGQGYGELSSWSRGQAWGLYGFALAYRYTKNREYLDISKKIAHYFICSSEVTGWIPRCDFRQPPLPQIFDTSAGAIAACGLLEISEHVPENEKALYTQAAKNFVCALERECDWTDTEDSILQNGTECYESGHHKPMIYSDYFFAEAIYRLMGFNSSILW